jgi:hypothetical protein
MLRPSPKQLAVADPKLHPEFAANVKAVDSHELWCEANVSPKNQDYHNNRNAETCLAAGQRPGRTMAELLSGKR